MGYSMRDYLSPHFTPGRNGNRVDKIVVHHAATTNFDSIGAHFQRVQVSAHYGVGQHNNVDRYVAENNIAWHAGDFQANSTSIGIENVNSSGAPHWGVSEETINTLVNLCRDVATRHGLLPLRPGHNFFQHKTFFNTYCAGRVGDRLQEIADRVNGGTSHPPTSPPASPDKTLDQIANEVLAGNWGNGADRERRLRAAGYDPHEVQRLVNQKLGIGVGPPPPPPQSGGSFRVGDKVVVTNPVDVNGTRLGVSGVYDVMEARGDRIVIGRGGVVTAAISAGHLRRA
jgi:hypothetical protein